MDKYMSYSVLCSNKKHKGKCNAFNTEFLSAFCVPKQKLDGIIYPPTDIWG